MQVVGSVMVSVSPRDPIVEVTYRKTLFSQAFELESTRLASKLKH